MGCAPYLGIDGPTDVLSFPASEMDPETGVHYIGDILISIPRAQAQADAAGHPLEAEVQLLVVHGVLHLLGHDHAQAEEKAARDKDDPERGRREQFRGADRFAFRIARNLFLVRQPRERQEAPNGQVKGMIDGGTGVEKRPAPHPHAQPGIPEQQGQDRGTPREDASIFIPIGIIAGVIIAVMAVWEFANAPNSTTVASRAPVTSSGNSGG